VKVLINTYHERICQSKEGESQRHGEQLQFNDQELTDWMGIGFLCASLESGRLSPSVLVLNQNISYTQGALGPTTWT